VVDTQDLKRRASPCPRARSHEVQAVLVSGDHMRGTHHAEILIMNRDLTDREGRVTATTHLGATASRTTGSTPGSGLSTRRSYRRSTAEM